MKTLPDEPDANMIEAAYPLLEIMPHDTPARARKKVRAIWKAMFEVAPLPPTTGLTRRQAQVQEFIAAYTLKHRRSPTYKEISDDMGIGRREDAYAVVRALERKGIIRRAKRRAHRSIVLLVRPGELPFKK